MPPSNIELIQEYCRLLKLRTPTETEKTRLRLIYELAQIDLQLHTLIYNAHQLIAMELGINWGNS